MLPTYVNAACVVMGVLAGRLAGTRLPDRLHETLLKAIGLITVALGVMDIVKTANALVMLGSFVAGGLVGELLRIEDGIAWIGRWAQTHAARESASAEPGSAGDFAKGFVTTSLLFCVGPLTVLGCFEAGLRHDYSKLLVKSIMDGISSLIFSAALGWGVMLSAVTVLVVQGALTLGAALLSPLLTAPMIGEMTATGGLMLLALGLNLLGLTKIRVASFVPSLVFALLAGGRWG